MTTMQTATHGLTQNHWRKIKNAPQRLVLCRLMIDIMRTVHSTYAPAGERFGTRLETFFIGLCVALGDIEDKPLTVTKIAVYMSVPRTTVIRRLKQLQSWGLIDRRRGTISCTTRRSVLSSAGEATDSCEASSARLLQSPFWTLCRIASLHGFR